MKQSRCALLLLALAGAASGLRAGPQPLPSPKVVGTSASELTNVLSQAVNMMNNGVHQFLEGEGSASLPPHGEHDPPPRLQDFLKVVQSQQKAVHLLHQLSQDFTALLGVAKKLEEKESHACARGDQSHGEKDLVKERDQLKSTVDYLLRRTQTCEDNLQQAQISFSKCNTTMQAQVKAKADADAGEVSDARSESELLQKQNDDLRHENEDLEKKVAELQGPAEQQAGALGSEVTQLRKKIASLEADKQAMMGTVQQFMHNNETEQLTGGLRTEVGLLRREQVQAEMRNRKQVETLQKELKGAKDENADLKEVKKSLQAENVNAQQASFKLQEDMQNFQQKVKDLEDDKGQLMDTLQATLRQNTQFKEEITQEKQVEETLRRDLAAKQSMESKRVASQPEGAEPMSAPVQHAKPVPAHLKVAKEIAIMSSNDPIATMHDIEPIEKYITTAGHEVAGQQYIIVEGHTDSEAPPADTSPLQAAKAKWQGSRGVPPSALASWLSPEKNASSQQPSPVPPDSSGNLEKEASTSQQQSSPVPLDSPSSSASMADQDQPTEPIVKVDPAGKLLEQAENTLDALNSDADAV